MSEIPIQTIITDPNAAETLVRAADDLGKNLKNMGLATGQIRALYGEVRQIEAMWGISEENRKKALRRLILLKPKMAYRSRRERGRAVEELIKVLDSALDQVIQQKNPKLQEDNFRRFVEFFEAILAYHKAYGGN